MSQRMDALAHGQEVRLVRHALKRIIEAQGAAEFILDPPEVIAPRPNGRYPVSIADLLSWQHRWGEVRARRLLHDLNISPTLSPFSLSPVTRRRIVEAL